MNNLSKKIKVSKRKKTDQVSSRENLHNFTQEELIEKILKLEAHNMQLQNIIQKEKKQFSQVSKMEKKFDFDKVSKRHVFLKFYYFGWDYQGYVTQEDTSNTIEYFLFSALKKCCLIESRESSNYHRCGRTDKGVSAFCQVISIDLRSKLSNPNKENQYDEFPYCSMLNRLLPDNIRCYSWAHVGSSISSRFDCSWRTYKYYFPRGNLNIKVMQDAALFFVGVHDFRNFCKMDVGNGVTEFQREIKFVAIQPCISSFEEPTGYQMYEFVIRGRGFLWHQIRCMMSVLLLIGQEKESPEVINQLLNVEENPSKPQYSMAIHYPLNLYEVEYEHVSIEWIVDDENLSKILELLQGQWTSFAVRTTMVRNAINDLEKLRPNSTAIEKQTELLLDEVKSKVYKPLLSRMKCESLEGKINHYIKRKKLEIVTEEEVLKP